MAVVSEGTTLYQARIAPSYVSSSGYYGYVPPCPIADYENSVVRQQQLGCVAEANGQTIAVSTGNRDGWMLSSSSFAMPAGTNRQQQEQFNIRRFNGSAMETDEDDHNCRSEYVAVSRCQNNHCVIPEAAGRLDGSNYYENVYRVVEQEAEAARRGNRKRNSAGQPAQLFAGQPANHAKRSRQDGGNGNVRYGFGSSGMRGSSTLRYEPTSVSNLGQVGEVCRPREICELTSLSVDDCRESAGNYCYDEIDDQSNVERPCKSMTINDGHAKFEDSYLDYEIMLMETHGCSSYHYCGTHRRFDVDVTEAEF